MGGGEQYQRGGVSKRNVMGGTRAVNRLVQRPRPRPRTGVPRVASLGSALSSYKLLGSALSSYKRRTGNTGRSPPPPACAVARPGKRVPLVLL